MTIEQIQTAINNKTLDARQLVNLLADYIQSNPSSPGGGSLLSATVTLTDAQIKALPSTDVEILPAPGVDKGIVLLFATLHLKNWAADYTNINASANIFFDWGNLVFVSESKGSAVTNLLALGGNSFNILGQDPNLVTGTPNAATPFGGIDPASVNNAAVILKSNNGGSDFTGGNAANTLKVTVYYVVVDL